MRNFIVEVDHKYSANSNCVCCEGDHRYATNLLLENGSSFCVQDELVRLARNLPDGAKFRLTIEEV